MGEVVETLPERRSSLAAPIVFIIVVAFQFFSRWLEQLKKGGGKLLVAVLTYVVLVCWFWRVPVASISQQLVQPFGKVISWRAGGVVNENVMLNKVGIIPWLILSTRVSKFVCRLAKF